MNAFTPGPWSKGKQRKVYAAGVELPVAQAVAAERDYREADANCRLIAAAPELYGALERIAAGVDGASAGKIAKRALARARGEEVAK